MLRADAAASRVCTRFGRILRPRLDRWRDACQDAVLELLVTKPLGQSSSGSFAIELASENNASVTETEPVAQRVARYREWFASSETLLLHGRDLTDLHVRMVAPLLLRQDGSPALRALWLQDNMLGDESLYALARAATRGALVSLETLNLGAQDLPPNRDNVTIAEQPPRYTAAGLGALLGATVPAHPHSIGRRAALASLVRLQLPSLLLTDKEAQAIAEALAAGGLPSLETLRISNNRITDVGARALVYALPQVPNFAKLEWHNNLVRGAIPLIQHICAHMTGRKVDRLGGSTRANQSLPEEEEARLKALALGNGVTSRGASPPFSISSTLPIAVCGRPVSLPTCSS